MEVESDLELDEFNFDSKQKYMGIMPVRKYYASLYGIAHWSIENDSFDYAGTHCTWGQSGTHHLPDYAQVQDFSLDQINVYFEVYDKEIGAWFEADRKFIWKHKKDRSFIQKFELDYREEIMEMLQDQEDKHESVVESLPTKADYY
tara:strand:- start:1180 stop:1617 length:438 start_codon:yes stop_codon:yes gene_type:complete